MSPGEQPAKQISPVPPCLRSSGQHILFRGHGPNLYPGFPPSANSGGRKRNTGTLFPGSYRWPMSIPQINCEDKWTKPVSIYFDDCLLPEHSPMPTSPKIPSIDLMRFSPAQDQNQKFSVVMKDALKISPVGKEGNIMSSPPLIGIISPVNVMHRDTLRGLQGPKIYATSSILLPPSPIPMVQPAVNTYPPLNTDRKPLPSPKRERRVSFNSDSTREK